MEILECKAAHWTVDENFPIKLYTSSSIITNNPIKNLHIQLCTLHSHEI